MHLHAPFILWKNNPYKLCYIFNQRTILSIFLLHTGNLCILDSVVQLWGQLRKQFLLSWMEMYHAKRILLQRGAVQNENNRIKHSKKVTKNKAKERFVVGPCGVKGEVVVVILAVMIGCRAWIYQSSNLVPIIPRNWNFEKSWILHLPYCGF